MSPFHPAGLFTFGHALDDGVLPREPNVNDRR
jgi:hypothetical protein